MAIKCDFNLHGATIPNAYVRVHEISGSRHHGWNALICAYSDAHKAKTYRQEPMLQFNIRIPYVEGQDPFPLMYEELAKHPFISCPVRIDDVPTPPGEGEAETQSGGNGDKPDRPPTTQP